jgi:hypothetical protein
MKANGNGAELNQASVGLMETDARALDATDGIML